MNQPPKLSRKQRCALWGFFAGSLALAGWLSATVVPESELEASKPQLGQTMVGANFILDWETQPDVYYFVEGSPDLVNWLPAKLLKDNIGDGSLSLSLGTAINLSKAFYRLSLEGDPGAARLRADDDGDGIINLLEVENDWDAFEAAASVDSEPDGLPDYWELFYFGTLDHDGSFIAVTGGLTLVEAFAAGTDPRNADSDGDAWTDAQELVWGWDVNYDQSRDDLRYARTGDFNGDGVSNITAAINGFNPSETAPNSLKFPPQYVVVDLGADQGFVSMSNAGHILTFDFSIDGAHNYLRIWYLGESSILSNDGFSSYNVADNGDLLGMITNAQLIDDLVIAGVQYPMANPDPDCILNDIGISDNLAPINPIGEAIIFGRIEYGSSGATLIKPSIQLVETGGDIAGCAYYRKYTERIRSSPDGQYIGGYAYDNYELFGDPATFFYTTRVTGNETTTTIKYPIPEALHIYGGGVLAVSNQGDILYRYRLFSGSPYRYFYNAEELTNQPASMNADGSYLSYDQGILQITQGGISTTITDDVPDGFDFGVNQDRMHIISGDDLIHVQNTNETTGLPVDISEVNAFSAFRLQDVANLGEDWSIVDTNAISDNAAYISVTARNDDVYHEFLLLKMDIVPDWDRNGVIDQADRGKATDSDPFRFWVNDDNDRVGQEVSNDDVPGQTGGDADAVTGFSGQVDGMRDLVDFFPLFFDLEDFLSSFDDLSTVDLKLSGEGMRFLKYEDGYAGFTPDAAGDFLTDINTARELADDDTRGISTDPNSPTDLGAEFVTLASQGKGVLLMESNAATDQPLKLHVFVDGNELFTYDFHLKTTTVEDMFEHRDLTGLAKEYDGTTASVPQSPAATRTTAPNWPDELTNGKTFAFVHGYNVSGQAARGWQAEVFKRMHQLGSNARFVGITWNGDTGLDYHKAVFQAFHTGDDFNASLSGDITVAAHSLGNVVIGQAIQSGSLIPTRYYMINAATPNEAYGSGGSATDMVEKDWTGIDASFYASNWHQQFSGSDARTGLKWVGAFSAVTQIETHNFYSPGEDVLDVLDGDNDASVLGQLLTGNFNFTRGAWKSQELVKGKTGFGSLASLALSRGQAGWRLNSSYQTGDDIKEIPRFSPFLEANLHSSNAQTASDTATQNVRFDLLARGIPALSDAAAVDTVPGVINFDMESSGRDPNEWPSEDHGGESSGDWLHSDFRNVALPYVNPMYQQMINQGALNAN